MCGFLLNIGEETIDANHPALEVIAHRGPDDRGAINFNSPSGTVSLGHRRLSIIDLSEQGRQPMSYDNGNLWITYNGEIYNYLEIRENLEKEGFSFVSESDTEVLLAAFRKWGKACLDRLNGMFAFTLFDKQANKIFIIRDRMGIKPVYLFNSPQGFSAVSEIKQLTHLKHFSPAVDHNRLYHFLNSGDFSYDAGTMWRDVIELQPGHMIEIDLNRWSPGESFKQKCWYAPDFTNTITISQEDASSEFRRLLKESVKLRLRADVPVGFLLSGGLDSSTLVGLASRMPRDKAANLKTFSSCYKNSPIDESTFIKDVLSFTGAKSSLHYPKPVDISNNLNRVIWSNDLPVRSGSPVPQWLLYEYIKNDNDSRKVILEGQGADEILCGYRDFFWAFLYENLSPSSFNIFFRELGAIREHHTYPLKVILRKFKRLMFPSTVKYPADDIIIANTLTGTEIIPDIPIRREQPTVQAMHTARLKILRYILHNVDRNSMAHSRETRVPFLDHNLVEFCLSLPSTHKISSGLTKQVLRNSMHGVMPESVRLRTDKQGYSSPVSTWVRGDLKDMFMEDIKIASALPFVRKELLIKATDNFFKNDGVFNPVWWNLIAFSRWQKIFKVSI